jgi:hypothetical protein
MHRPTLFPSRQRREATVHVGHTDRDTKRRLLDRRGEAPDRIASTTLRHQARHTGPFGRSRRRARAAIDRNTRSHSPFKFKQERFSFIKEAA